MASAAGPHDGRRGAARGRDLGIVALCACLVVAVSAARRSGGDAGSSLAAPGSIARPSPLPPGASAPTFTAPEDESAGCHFAEAGFGIFERWRPLPALPGSGAQARVLLPPQGPGDALAVLVHLHGAEAVRKVLATAITSAPSPSDVSTVPLAVVGIDAGTRSSHYERALGDPTVLGSLVDGVARAASDAWGRAVRVDRVAVSSWSAGYGAVAVILRKPDPRLRALVLLDSLHASYDVAGRGIAPGALDSFERFARAAADGGPLLYVTHTEIEPDGYASTRETAEDLLVAAGGERGNLHVRAYPGANAEAHCDQLRLIGDIVTTFVRPALR